MTPRRRGVRRFFSLPGRRPVHEEVDTELRHHVAERVDALIAAGWAREEARREAMRRFGDLERIRAACESLGHETRTVVRRGEVFGSVLQDIRYAVRGMRRAPGFSAAVIVTLGVGVGVNTAIFAFVDTTLIRPLPFAAPDQVVDLWARVPDTEFARRSMPIDKARAWREANDLLVGVTLLAPGTAVLTGVEEPVSVRTDAVSVNWLSVLGVAPLMGRGFDEADAVPGAPPVAIASDAFWRTHLGGDRDAVGRVIELDERSRVLIGVMPPQFNFPVREGRARLWVPLAPHTGAGPDNRWVYVTGRLPDDASIPQAQERFDVLAEGFEETDPRPGGWGLRVQSHGTFRANREVRQGLWLLAGAVALMLLIAVANVVNLFLVRGSARAREIAVRLAIGASRRRLLRQVITEGAVFALASGGLALLVALVAIDAISRIVPSELNFFASHTIGIDGRVIIFACVAAVLTALAASVFPAWRTMTQIRSPSATRMASLALAGRPKDGLRRGLVVAEIALSMTLLAGAGLLIESFVRLTRVDPGFNPEGLVQMSLSLSPKTYETGEIRYAFLQRLKEQLVALPGVRAVALADGVPPSTSITFGEELMAEGRPAPAGQPSVIPSAQVEPEFFRILEIPILTGRNFQRGDDPRTTAIVDATLAQFLWSGEDPIGRRFRSGTKRAWMTVVGVVGDVKLEGPDDREGAFDYFLPLPEGTARSYLSLVIGTTGETGALLPQIRKVVRDLSPNQPVSRLWTMRDAMADDIDKPRFLLVLMGIFAGVALGLAALGMYGVLSFIVSQRARELGIRVALGASASALRGMVLRDGTLLGLAGVALGLAGAVVAARLIRGLLFGVSPTDPATLGAVAIVMLATALLASYLPARRATRVDPVRILNAE